MLTWIRNCFKKPVEINTCERCGKTGPKEEVPLVHFGVAGGPSDVTKPRHLCTKCVSLFMQEVMRD